MNHILVLKIRFLIAFLLVFNSVQAQNFEQVDTRVSSYPSHFENIDALVLKISQDFKSQKQQVRAVFHWIASNIKYNLRESGILNRPISFRTKEEYERKKVEARKRLAQRVFQKKVAVCEGYSSLFKEICDRINIQNEIVTGCAKNQYQDIGEPFDSNHAWNLVYIDNQPFLVDTTWGALLEGSSGDRSTIEWYYFFPDPNTLIRTHYPDETRHSLLETVPSKKAFMLGPMYYNENMEPRFELVAPKQNGLLNSGEVYSFTFKTQVPIQFIGYSVGDLYQQIDNYNVVEDTLNFTVPIAKKSGAEVLIFLNGNAVVAYKTQ